MYIDVVLLPCGCVSCVMYCARMAALLVRCVRIELGKIPVLSNFSEWFFIDK